MDVESFSRSDLMEQLIISPKVLRSQLDVFSLSIFENIPHDILIEMLSFLSSLDMIQFTTLSISFYSLYSSMVFWNILLKKRAGILKSDNIFLDSWNLDDFNSIKDYYFNLNKNATLIKCSVCGGFPIDGPYFKCMHCTTDTIYCNSCEEKYHAKLEHIAVKFYPTTTKLEEGNIWALDTLKLISCHKCRSYCEFCYLCLKCNDPINLCTTCYDESSHKNHKVCKVRYNISYERNVKHSICTCIICKSTDSKIYYTCDCQTKRLLLCKECIKCHEEENHNTHQYSSNEIHICLCDNDKSKYCVGVTGIRYKCTVCRDFDLCEVCETQFCHDIDHPLMKIYYQAMRDIIKLH